LRWGKGHGALNAATTTLLRTFSDNSARPQALICSLGTQEEVLISAQPVHMVTLPTTDGELAVMAEHGPHLCELVPGVVSIYETKQVEKPKTYFVTGGIALVEVDSSIGVSVMEAIPLEDLDVDAAQKRLEESKATLESNPQDIDAKIGEQVFSAIVKAVRAYGG